MYSVSRNWATAHDMRLNLKVATESFANAADTAQLSSAKLTPRAPVTLGEGDRPIPARRMRTPSHSRRPRGSPLPTKRAASLVFNSYIAVAEPAQHDAVRHP
jgi:hypothetical protein